VMYARRHRRASANRDRGHIAMTITYEFHSLAELFPLLEGADFEELVSDIRKHGLQEPVVLFEGKILDGRNRYRACAAAGIQPALLQYRGKDPLACVVSANLRRRHLSESQRAMVAAKLANLKDGQRADLVEGLPIGRASELLNVGERTIARAREVREHGALELQQAVEHGDISVSAAADIATQPIDEQREIVARGEREILRKSQEIRAARTEQRRAQRISRAIELSARNAPLPADRKYALILADPPWRYDWAGEPAPEVQPVALPTTPSSPKAITARDGMDDEIPL
jgi:ParB-like chromosome segregation protein Spo0J